VLSAMACSAPPSHAPAFAPYTPWYGVLGPKLSFGKAGGVDSPGPFVRVVMSSISLNPRPLTNPLSSVADPRRLRRLLLRVTAIPITAMMRATITKPAPTTMGRLKPAYFVSPSSPDAEVRLTSEAVGAGVATDAVVGALVSDPHAPRKSSDVVVMPPVTHKLVALSHPHPLPRQ
jgi:hypothetical protein